jgi:hypothetical protein
MMIHVKEITYVDNHFGARDKLIEMLEAWLQTQYKIHIVWVSDNVDHILIFYETISDSPAKKVQ